MSDELAKADYGQAATGSVKGLDSRKTSKHERADRSIENLSVVLVALERLSAKVSAEPLEPRDDTSCDAFSLEDHLNAAPERIECFISAAQSVIDQIEEKLF